MDPAIARLRRNNFLCRRRRNRALSHRDRQLPRQSRLGCAHALGCAAADGRRAAVRDFRSDRRPRRGRSLDRNGQRSRRCGADAGAGARGDRCLRRRASRRAAILQARARPRRSGGAGAARTDAERTRMSEPEHFIARWSRRKRKAAEDAEAMKSSPAPDAAAESAHPIPDQHEGSDAPRARSGASEPPEFASDPAKLPPIETITAATDIRPFLAPGVPPELTRAALRRAWAADPKIRDFVGLADYDWDFNAPGAMTGFGSLEMTDELRQQIARMVGRSLANDATDGPAQTSAEVQGKPSSAATSTESVVPAAEVSTQHVQSDAETSQPEGIGTRNESHNSTALPQRSKVDIASRNNPENSDNDQLIAKRPHGRALPK